VLRELDTSSGKQKVWATADDSEQASYVNGQLQVCSRSAACATSTQWLMPGFGVTEVVPRFLPYSFRGLLPPSQLLTRIYLRAPRLWPLFGNQFLALARKLYRPPAAACAERFMATSLAARGARDIGACTQAGGNATHE
jgi:hypothetical protein